MDEGETCATVEDPPASERGTTIARSLIPEHQNDVCSMVTCKPQQYIYIYIREGPKAGHTLAKVHSTSGLRMVNRA